MSDDELRMSFAHEIAHFERRDLWRDVPISIVGAIFFFHPMLWLASREMAFACEECCDGTALRVTGASRSAYAHLLIESARAGFGGVAMGSSIGYVLLQRRLEMLKKNLEFGHLNRNRWTCMVALAGMASMPFTLVAAQTPKVTTSTHKASPVAKAKAAKSRKHQAKKLVKSVVPAAKHAAAAPITLASMTQQLDPNVVTLVANDPAGPIVSAHFAGIQLKTALDRVFVAAGVNYIVKSDVNPDTVTCSLRKLPLVSALEMILTSVKQPLTYRVEGGTYIITAKAPQAVQTLTAPAAQPAQEPQIDVDNTIGATGTNDLKTPISLTAEQADVRLLLNKVFDSHGSYTIDPTVQGIVTLSLRNVSFGTALDNILRQVDATYRVEGSIIHVVRKNSKG